MKTAFTQSVAILIFVGLMYGLDWYPPYISIVIGCVGAVVVALIADRSRTAA